MASPAAPPSPITRLAIRARGTVQGVGFRPFVFRAALAEGLAGFVRNGPDGVEIEAEGAAEAVARLLEALRDVPAPARLDALSTRPVAPRHEPGFRIAASGCGEPDAFSLPPDLVTCEACMAEVLDPASRRYRHPFASCARCGPRYSVVEALPWDRSRTSMAAFEACPECRAEHDDPRDRRFHAQTLACRACGPRLRMLEPDRRVSAEGEAALQQGIATLRNGGILAMLGLGGFQLLIDARDETAVRRLRERKQRPEKPLALLVRDADAAQQLVRVGPVERDALGSTAGPIVLARRRADAMIAPSVAPGIAWLGVMLPTTPLHRLILDGVDGPLVATSGNRSGEPLCVSDGEALAALGEVADACLTHDRAVLRPVDDSVVRVIAQRPVTLRCARGLAPHTLVAVAPVPALGAMGGDLKSAVAVAVGSRILLGPHIGDLETARAQNAAVRDLRRLSALTGIAAPQLIADAHPDWHAGQLAREIDPQSRTVGHHHAHVLACLAEHAVATPVLGVAWDGGGFGGDGTVWGGEFLRVTGAQCERLAHLRQFRLPGGEAAVREPRRAALGALHQRFGAGALHRDDPPLRSFTREERRAIFGLLDAGRFAPETSSAGRLFDVAAALLDVRQRCSFEGQAALELESLAETDPERLAYPMALSGEELDWAPLLDALLADRDAGVPIGVITMRFHRGLACGIVAVAKRAAAENGLERVVLTGGCFQNALLSELARAGLIEAKLEPLLHERVPPNDGGLAVGQILAAAAQTRDRPRALEE